MKIIKSNLRKEPFQVCGKTVELIQDSITFGLGETNSVAVDKAKVLAACLDILYLEKAIGFRDNFPAELIKRELSNAIEVDFDQLYQQVLRDCTRTNLYEHARALEANSAIVPEGHEIVICETCGWEIGVDIYAAHGPRLYFYRRLSAAILPIDAVHMNTDNLVEVA